MKKQEKDRFLSVVSVYHEEAMDLYEEGLRLQRRGLHDDGLYSMIKGLELEQRAADLVEPYHDMEPTRSVLHRSAATMALRCERFDEALEYCLRGLEGRNSPDEIRVELQEILDRIE